MTTPEGKELHWQTRRDKVSLLLLEALGSLPRSFIRPPFLQYPSPEQLYEGLQFILFNYLSGDIQRLLEANTQGHLNPDQYKDNPPFSSETWGSLRGPYPEETFVSDIYKPAAEGAANAFARTLGLPVGHPSRQTLSLYAGTERLNEYTYRMHSVIEGLGSLALVYRYPRRKDPDLPPLQRMLEIRRI